MENRKRKDSLVRQGKVKRGPLYYIGLLAVLCLSALIGYFVQSPYGENCRVYKVTVILEVDRESALELYYDTGSGFHEKDHQEMSISSIGEKSSVEFTVAAWRPFTQFRIDPVGASVKMKIYEIVVSSGDGSFTHSVSLENISPVQQIVGERWNGEYFIFETEPDATDPMLLTETIDDPHVQKAKRSLSVYVLWICGGLLVMLLVNWIYRFFILGL